jgi:MoaA/NifB/PqqE/SkfB family radical SAM enzyme
VLLGGEPTLHPDLAAIIRRARTLGYASITVDTNGYLFHHILDRVKPAEVDFFSFSLDGASEAVNDGIRGAGSYRRCTAGIRQAVQGGFGVSVIFTVSSLNRHELKDMALLLEDLGVNRFFIQVIGLRGASARDAQADSLQVSRDQWLETVPSVAADIAAQGITVSYPKVFLEEGDVFECAGRVADNYFVFPNGRVYRCPLCEDFALHSLEIADGRLVERPPINEKDLFALTIPEGCVMNRLVQPGNLAYLADGRPAWRIACCLLKEEIPARDVLK